MLSSKDLDHHLLFKKLVILEDETSQPEKKEVEVSSEDKAIEPSETRMEEKTTVEQKLALPMQLIVCEDSIAQALKATDSNLMKICNALKLQDFHNNIFAYSDAITQSPDNTKFLWTIGLEDAQIKTVGDWSVSMIIDSPNMEAPMSTAQKVEMYEPLKQFAAEYHSSK